VEKAVPAVGLVGTVLLPGMNCRLVLRDESATLALNAARSTGGAEIAVFAARCWLQTIGSPSAGSPPSSDDALFSVGTIGRINRIERSSELGHSVASIEGNVRIRRLRYLQEEPYRIVGVETLSEREREPALEAKLAAQIWSALASLRATVPKCGHVRRMIECLSACQGPETIPAAACELFASLSIVERQRILETDRLSARLELILHSLCLHVGLAHARSASRSS
jgi:Lon protease-like protein